MNMEAQLKAMNSFINSPVGRQMKLMAEQNLKSQKSLMAQKVQELSKLKEMGNPTITLASNAGEKRFVKVDGIVSYYTVSQNGKVSDIKPVTAKTYEGLDDLSKANFNSTFKAEAMALEYGSFDQKPSMDYYNKVVVANGMDSHLFELELNRPKVEHDMDFHKVPEVYNAYDSYEDYTKGITKEMKAYQQATSIEGRQERKAKIEELETEIKSLEREVGMSSSYVQFEGGNGE
ncbi:hypothetical protein [Metabacillus sediminilitoris]|uniref:Uncharacterized protein n=1 Tax=Metabacillus sediminilitoris TaxID=2567941 RepID=A0A4S4BXF7_9BACI|nr:hypothetical protein [Metabacillus sediminilitoris]QGQ46327.1 hypothetical protein GMB29_14535 [Metabacillus sediminilitoris]THF79376.1 hypothetical protein E6W99_13635 [Metabacillus sediminilitoris]